MVQLGADYSYARPGGAVLRAAGVTAVGRYLAPESDGRQIEKPEFDDLTAHGVGVWFVREGAASGILGGFARGVSDAQVAVANLARLGLSSQVVYAAADFDISTAQFTAADDYMRGFASVIGLNRTGIYGGMRYINHCRGGLATWFWRAGATSWDHGETGFVHLQQTTLSPPVAGSDHNYIYATVYGQVGSPAAGVVEEEDEDMAKIKGASYASNGTTIFILFNEESGFYVEHSGVGGSYNNPIAQAWETGSWAPITAGHAVVLKAALDKVRAGVK